MILGVFRFLMRGRPFRFQIDQIYAEEIALIELPVPSGGRTLRTKADALERDFRECCQCILGLWLRKLFLFRAWSEILWCHYGILSHVKHSANHEDVRNIQDVVRELCT